MRSPRRQHTFTVTISGPAWLTRRDAKREVRTLINDQANWGAFRGGDSFDQIDEGDIKVRGIA